MFSNHTAKTERQGVSLFTKRRRPRQAAYPSPPAQNPTTPLHIDIPDDALLEMAQDFENNAQSYNHIPSNNRSYHSYGNQKPSSQNRQFCTPQKHPNNYGENVACQKRPRLEPRDIYLRGRNENSLGQQQSKRNVDMPRSYTANGNSFQTKYQNSANGPRRNLAFVDTNIMSKPQQSFSGKMSAYSWNSNINNNHGSARQPRSGQRASFGAAINVKKLTTPAKRKAKFVKENLAAVETALKKHTKTTYHKKNNVNERSENGERGFSLQTVDKSIRVVTTTIQGVKKWSEYRDQVPLVFEIFVTLDSVPTSNNAGTAKLFNIKDSTGSNRCIFWEMDQKLPKMTRGQVYRLVGSSERKTGNFQCYVVRQSQANEQHLAKQRIDMCHEAMTKVVSTIAES